MVIDPLSISLHKDTEKTECVVAHRFGANNHFVLRGSLEVKFRSLGFNQSLINRFLVNALGYRGYQSFQITQFSIYNIPKRLERI